MHFVGNNAASEDFLYRDASGRISKSDYMNDLQQTYLKKKARYTNRHNNHAGVQLMF